MATDAFPPLVHLVLFAATDFATFENQMGRLRAASTEPALIHATRGIQMAKTDDTHITPAIEPTPQAAEPTPDAQEAARETEPEPTPGALEALIELVERYEISLEMGRPFMQSVMEPIRIAVRRLTSYEVKTLDASFGRLLKEREHLPDARDRAKLENLIVAEVEKCIAAGPVSNWKDKYAEIGEKINLGATTVEKIHRAKKAREVRAEEGIFAHAMKDNE
jgi:hypothetical protein